MQTLHGSVGEVKAGRPWSNENQNLCDSGLARYEKSSVYLP